MGKIRICRACKNKYDNSFFETAVDTKCKACILKGKRLTAKFFEMVTSEITGLAELQVFLDDWYPVR